MVKLLFFFFFEGEGFPFYFAFSRSGLLQVARPGPARPGPFGIAIAALQGGLMVLTVRGMRAEGEGSGAGI